MTENSKDVEAREAPESDQADEAPEGLGAAMEIAAAGREALEAGAIDMAEGLDAMREAECMAQLSESLAEAGATDLAQGANLIPCQVISRRSGPSSG